MKQIYSVIFISVFVLSLISCKQKKEGSDSTVEESQVLSLALPPLPLEQQSYLFENVEGIDYIFNDLPFSVSQADKPSIQANIAGISRDGVEQLDCSPMGRMFFQVRGEIVLEADVYYTPPQCVYYVYFEDGQPKYANKMTANNASFYQQFLDRMKAESQ